MAFRAGGVDPGDADGAGLSSTGTCSIAKHGFNPATGEICLDKPNTIASDWP